MSAKSQATNCVTAAVTIIDGKSTTNGTSGKNQLFAARGSEQSRAQPRALQTSSIAAKEEKRYLFCSFAFSRGWGCVAAAADVDGKAHDDDRKPL